MSAKYLRNIVNLTLFVVGILLFCILVPKLLVFFMPFVIGWIITLLANPLVRFMEKRLKIVRKHGSALIIAAAIALVVTLLYFVIAWVIRQLSGVVELLPDLYNTFLGDLEDIGTNLQGFASGFPPQVSEGIASLTDSLTQSLGTIIGAIGKPTVEAAGTVAKNIPSALIYVIFTILSAYFFIAEKERIMQILRDHVPQNLREKWHLVMNTFRTAVGGYFKAQFKIMGIVALILFVGFLILDINYAILLAFLIALLDFFPFFGTGTVLWPWAIFKVLSGDYPFAVGLMIIYLVSQLVRQLIQPKVVGDTIGLKPLPTLFFMYIGYRVSSIFGMIIAVPIGMIIISFYQAGAFEERIQDVKELVDGLNEFRRRK